METINQVKNETPRIPLVSLCFGYVNVSGNVPLQRVARNVLRCTNSRCKANFWNRDVNAARNMLELPRSGLTGKLGASRLRAFRRDSH